MDHAPDLAALARSILDANVYLILGTADAAGLPWANPVFYATADHTAFYWISSPEVSHSRNIAVRPDVSLVVFDSTVRPSTGQAVYMRATAREVTVDDVEAGLAIYPGPPSRGARTFSSDELRPPLPYRLYTANVHEHSVLCPRDSGVPCAEHGWAYDHRTNVTL